MRLYVHGYLGADYGDMFELIAADGHEVHLLDPSMNAQEVYNEVLEADLIVFQNVDEDTERGTVLGLALAFGKQTYVIAGIGDENMFFELDGVVVYHDIYDLLPDVRAALKELSEDGEDSRLDGPPGGDTDGGGAGAP